MEKMICKKTFALVTGLMSIFLHAWTSDPGPLAKDIPGWFTAAKFGVFVHFAENGHFRYFTDTSKVQGKEHDPGAYIKGAKYYTLSSEDVESWARKINEWGARYAVLTTKHRPGFALWDTRVHDRNIVDMSPSKLDVVEAWTRSLRGHGVKVGYYFSHYDWGDEDFIMAKSTGSPASEEAKAAAWKRYLDKRDRMVQELVTQYGKVDLIWWDEDWCAKDYKELRADPLLDLVFKHQPDVVINNRCRHPWRWHYSTPEKYVPLKTREGPWETCDNLTQGTGWGYKFPYGYTHYKYPEDILLTFLDVIAGGGNYLLNIGPRPDGKIPEEELEIMEYIGRFINQNEEAIYNTSTGIPRVCFGGPSTRKGDTLYLFAIDKPLNELTVKGIDGEIDKVVHLGTGKSLPYRLTGGRPKHGRPAWIRIKVPTTGNIYPAVYKLVFREGFTVKL
jgi:alpha-L-fucosidase